MYIGMSEAQIAARTKREKAKSLSLKPKVDTLMDFVSTSKKKKYGKEYYEKMFFARLRPYLGQPLKLDNEYNKILKELLS